MRPRISIRGRLSVRSDRNAFVKCDEIKRFTDSECKKKILKEQEERSEDLGGRSDKEEEATRITEREI